jgi:hypothetical protein
MTRLTTVTACLVASALATSAYAQSQTDIAEKYNEEGKTLMFKTRYAEATGKFRQAIARIPGEPKYYLNLCMSLFHDGKFGEALAACNAVENNGPNAEQRTKADKLTGLIKKEAEAQNIAVEPVGGGTGPGEPALDCNATPDDPRCGQTVSNDICRTNPQDPSCGGAADPNTNPNTGQPPPRYAVGRPPSGTGVFVSTTPDNKYTWTLGVDLFGGGGSIGQSGFYGTAGAGLRIKGDYMLNAATRVGAQGYLQITHFGPGAMDRVAVDTLDIFDLGIAAYKHLCPRNAQRICLTPLAGVQLAMMSPAGEENGAGEQVFNYAALGGRLELGAQFALGSRMEHVLGVMVGVNVYSQVFSGPEDDFGDALTIAQAGLDKGGAAAYIGIGYTHRFRTPLGRAPFITLE